MDLAKIHDYLTTRIRIEEIPITWDATGYTSVFFNTWVESPAFSGWSDAKSDEEEVGTIVNLLGVKPGDSLLDVCCGYGRHSILLADTYNLKVTGIDISPGLITAANRLAAEKGLDIDFEVKHGADISWQSEFDSAVIADNSFSLFSPDDAPRVLQGIHRALRPGGHLFLDLDNKPYNCRYGTRNTHWYLWPSDLTLQEIYFYKDISVEINRDTIFKKESEEINEFILFKRIYSQQEICNLLNECSYRIDRIYGDWDLSPLGDASPKMLLVAEKV